jgi:hypothetical protein
MLAFEQEDEMTEEEAKTKWCPHVRYMGSNLQECGANRWKQILPVEEPDALNPVACRCIGSACMAWRWIGDEFMDALDSSKAPRGYCGLAGKP